MTMAKLFKLVKRLTKDNKDLLCFLVAEFVSVGCKAPWTSTNTQLKVQPFSS